MLIRLERCGAFFEAWGEREARAVADATGRTFIPARNGLKATCGIPYHQIARAKAQLRDAGHEVELIEE